MAEPLSFIISAPGFIKTYTRLKNIGVLPPIYVVAIYLVELPVLPTALLIELLVDYKTYSCVARRCTR